MITHTITKKINKIIKLTKQIKKQNDIYNRSKKA